MQYRFSERIMAAKPSATRAVAEKAKEMAKQGFPVISFSAGEPDFISPPATREWAIKGMDAGDTHYTGTAGNAAVREAVCGYYKREFDLVYQPDEVIVGAGAKPLLYEALGCLVDPGDEVIIFAPAWVSYVEQVGLFAGKAIIVDTAETGLQPRIEAVKKVLTPKTKVIMLNTPNNPTGKIYHDAFIIDLCTLAREKGIIILNDEIYEKIVFDGRKYHNPVQLMPESRDVVINVNGASKAFAMTGWRIGYATGPREIIKKMSTMQGHVTSAPCTIAQWATVGAIKESASDVAAMAAEYQTRKDAVMELLDKCRHIKCDQPEGTFYAFFDVRPLVGKTYKGKVITDDVTFCEIVIEEAHIAFVPGTAFLAPGFVRMSFATALPQIREGLERLRLFLEAID